MGEDSQGPQFRCSRVARWPKCGARQCERHMQRLRGAIFPASVGVLLVIVVVAAAMPQGTFDEFFRQAEAAKARGDMAAMEQALIRAHAVGPGTEYTWRSLAWAQMHQGKWRESLANARENVRRNGKTSWSLSQLYESAMAAGDTALARRALDEEARLPAELRNRSLDGERRAFRAATRPTAYDLRWRLNVADYKIQKGEIVINTPFRRHLWQRATVSRQISVGSA